MSGAVNFTPEVRSKLADAMHRRWQRGDFPKRDDAYRANISKAQKRRWQEGRGNLSASHAAADQRRVVFDTDMRRIAIAGYWAGRHPEIVAEDVGVGRSTLTNFWRSEGLGNRRLIPGFYTRKQRRVGL